MRLFQDMKTGRTIQAIGEPGTDTGRHYFTAMSWMSDNRHIVLNAKLGTFQCQYVKFDTVSGTTTVLAEDEQWAAGAVSPDDKLYYIRGNEIMVIDLTTMEKNVCYRAEQGKDFHGPLSFTNDGQTLGTYMYDPNGICSLGTIDLASGLLHVAAIPQFVKPYSVANHAMVNPVNPNLVYYAHEGKTEFIPDRLWVADMRTGEVKNIYRQKRLEDGTLVEYCGHEMWASNGEGMYFVKYSPSPLKPTGVFFADYRGENWAFINGDYAYWHACVSPDGRYIVADTHELITKIVLIDLQTKTSELLCEQQMWWDHPGHPHPSFSPDSRKVSFTFADEDNRLWAGIIEL
ncbi:oligogalacturonate lyase family protein [Paenibacillus mendelii]|nr:oligogalacturonate lyase family protein [Paenibacillus mendelii]